MEVMNKSGLEVNTGVIMDVVEMDMDDVVDDEEEEEFKICRLVALNLDTGVEVCLAQNEENSLPLSNLSNNCNFNLQVNHEFVNLLKKIL